MVRPSRIDVEGGWYQVVNRGIERRSIFKKQRSYAHFLELPSKCQSASNSKSIATF